MLANQTAKDLWICVPDQASDDYVRQMAIMLRDRLDPRLALYVEFSNEVWNWEYLETRRNSAAAIVEGSAGPCALNDYGAVTNQGYWGWRRVAAQTVRISRIFSEVFGPTAMNTRVRPVLASQMGYRYMLPHQLEWMARRYGPPSQFIYGIAGAPYFGPTGADRTRTDLTVDQVVALTDASLNYWITLFRPDPNFRGRLDWGNMPTYASLARFYGLRSLAYEGGPDTAGAASLQAKIAANRDPRFAASVERFLHAWYDNGNDLCMYFTLSGADGQYGEFGLYTDLTEDTPKSQAVERVAQWLSRTPR
ncbi:MAG: hypothetical protein FJX76_17190 [Armatimonadetes bacterium]|nr:hypothetical protein [Armatimonadota bacterium]